MIWEDYGFNPFASGEFARLDCVYEDLLELMPALAIMKSIDSEVAKYINKSVEDGLREWIKDAVIYLTWYTPGHATIGIVDGISEKVDLWEEIEELAHLANNEDLEGWAKFFDKSAAHLRGMIEINKEEENQ